MPEAPDTILLRPARRDDLDAMAAITAEVFGPFSVDAAVEAALGRAGRAGWADLKAAGIRRAIDRYADACFVAERAGRVVGFVTCSVDESASRGHILDLAVARFCQNRGVGRRLLLRALERFRERGLQQAKIDTLETNPVGQHLYPSLGFREVVRQIHYVMPLD